MNTDLFTVQIIAREGIVFQGKVSSISSYNEQGRFDVLGKHANFISLIQKEIKIVDTQGKETKMVINNALIKVFENNVKIYVGIEGIINTPNTYSVS